MLRYCKLFCSLSFEHAELVSEVYIEKISEWLFDDISHAIAQKNPIIGKRALGFPSRLKRHVLNTLDFDEVDSSWLLLKISTFLTAIEKESNLNSY